jgi:hypothetical protein
MLTVLRYTAAVIAASIIGEIVIVPIALGIDAINGAVITGGDWKFNFANLASVCLKGAAIGCVAGTIAKKQGVLVSALAVFLPLVGTLLFGIVSAISTGQLIDPSRYATVLATSKLSLWTLVALAPAMLFGYMSANEAQRSRWLVLGYVGMLTAFGGAFVALFAIHFYTVYLAYEASGPIAAFFTLGFPFVAELFWLVAGTFSHDYTMRLLTCGALAIFMIVLGGLMASVASKYNAKRATFA